MKDIALYETLLWLQAPWSVRTVDLSLEEQRVVIAVEITGLRCDQTIMLTAPKADKDYPQHLRRTKFYDAEHDRHLVFLTNNFGLPALAITKLYRCRWQVELFFKWTNSISGSSGSTAPPRMRSKHKYGSQFRFTSWSPS